MSLDAYRVIDPETGEFFDRVREYNCMSRRPGIASGWFSQFSGSVYPHDYVVVGGRKMQPPRFYDSRYEIDHPDDFEIIKSARRARALERASRLQPSLQSQESVTRSRVDLLLRHTTEGF